MRDPTGALSRIRASLFNDFFLNADGVVRRAINLACGIAAVDSVRVVRHSGPRQRRRDPRPRPARRNGVGGTARSHDRRPRSAAHRPNACPRAHRRRLVDRIRCRRRGARLNPHACPRCGGVRVRRDDHGLTQPRSLQRHQALESRRHGFRRGAAEGNRRPPRLEWVPSSRVGSRRNGRVASRSDRAPHRSGPSGGWPREAPRRRRLRMGCDVVALNAQADGHFPGRDPEPTEENLRLLMSTVPAAKADLGIAHDGDGDRMVAVDREGRFVGGDALLVLFAKREVRRGLGVPVDASMVLEDLLPKATVWRTRVGDVYVAAELKRRGADFGGEPSGTWIFPKASYCPDGVYAAARLVSLVAENPLASLVRGIPRYPVIRGAIEYDRSKRRAIEARLDSAMRSLASDVTTVDGWRLQFDDGWALVRFSGTEPKIRVLAESRDDARAKEIYSTVLSSAKGAAA